MRTPLRRAFVLVSLALPAAAESTRFEITRDTWVSAVGQETDFNTGGSARLKLKGVQEFSIVDIDANPLRGKVITGAELHVKNASKEILGRVTVSSLSSEWAEGTSGSYAKEKGAASFNWAMQDVKPWAGPGSDITAVCLGQGGTLWGFADASPPDKDGWQVIPVDPRVVQARVAGISCGFVVMDDVGSEYERDGEKFKWKLFPNRFVFSREQSNAKPYFVIRTDSENHQPPAAPALAGRPIRHGEGTGDGIALAVPPAAGGQAVIGFVARYGTDEPDWSKGTAVPQCLVPVPQVDVAWMPFAGLDLKPGQSFWLGVRSIDGAGNMSEPVVAPSCRMDNPQRFALPGSTIQPFTDAAPPPTVGALAVSVIDALDKVHPVSGRMIPAHVAGYRTGNHLWSASTKTVRLFAARNEFVDFQVLLSGTGKDIHMKLTMPETAATAALSRFRFVNTKAGPMPDPLVPGKDAFDLPDADVKDQTNTGIVADVYVLHDAKPGVHHGTVTVSVGGQSIDLDVELHVRDFTLPDVLSFIPEMNCYGLPEGQELAYYRIAHAHRTNLNRLGYSWRGIPADRCAPKWDGKRFEWDAYDRRFGPLLDGSAFKDLPRANVPVDGFYLPLNENWPVDVNAHFKGGYWADQAFDAEYEKRFREAPASSRSTSTPKDTSTRSSSSI